MRRRGFSWGRWDSFFRGGCFKGFACYRLDVGVGPLLLSCAWWRRSWRERQGLAKQEFVD